MCSGKIHLTLSVSGGRYTYGIEAQSKLLRVLYNIQFHSTQHPLNQARLFSPYVMLLCLLYDEDIWKHCVDVLIHLFKVILQKLENINLHVAN